MEDEEEGGSRWGGWVGRGGGVQGEVKGEGKEGEGEQFLLQFEIIFFLDVLGFVF